MPRGLTAGYLADQLAHRRRPYLECYAPAAKLVGDVAYLGDAEGNPGRSLPIPLRPNGKPLVDFAAGPVGDDLDLLQRLIGSTPGEAFKEAIAFLGLGGTTTAPRPRPAKAAAPAAPKRPPTLADALRLWKRTEQITLGTPAGAYLTGRHCSLPHPDGDLRWLPDCPHPHCSWRGPCLLALVTDPVTVEPITLHRTWLQPDGSGKAPVEKPRLYWPGQKEHGTCRLWPDDEVTLGLLVGEGIETCLTAARVFRPVWSCLDAGGLAAFPVLDGIDCLTILADHDAAEILAARACAGRWLAAGREVKPYLPAIVGSDMNDEARP